MIVAEDHRTGELYVRNRAGLIAGRGVPYRYQGQDERHAVEMAEYRATFRLIAAAPDLLAALEALVAGLDKTTWSSWQTTAYFMDQLESARAALSRARGESGSVDFSKCFTDGVPYLPAPTDAE